MDRRELLKGVGWATLAGSLAPSGLWAAAQKNAQPDYSRAFASIDVDALGPTALKVSGRFPEEVRGVLYRNGPARLAYAGKPATHWFNGDGMVQRFVIGERAVSHRGKFVQTYKYQGESALGRYAVGSEALPGRNNDDFNTANTSVLPVGEDLLALWEGGSAYRLDPETLATRGLKTWGPDMEGLPFSAHPLREKDGSYWNFGLAPYVGKGMLLLYRFSASGELLKFQKLPIPFPGYAHAFTQSENHLLFLLAPQMWDEAAGTTWFDKAGWKPEQGTAVLVIRKADLTLSYQARLPAGLVFHFGRAHEDGEGIVLNACWYKKGEIMHMSIADILKGSTPSRSPEQSENSFARIRVQAGRADAEILFRAHAFEFPVLDPRFETQAARWHWGVYERLTAGQTHTSRIARHDAEHDEVLTFDYGTGVMPEEHLFIPSSARRKEGQGWLLGSALDTRSGQTQLNVFAADHLADGPLATAVLPYGLPFGFHGAFKKAV